MQRRKHSDANQTTSVETGQQYRDILKAVVYNTSFCIIGIENQTDIHYVFPVRAMLYDAASYKKQWNQIKRRHKKLKDLKGAEFLSGFSKNDYLQAVVTLIVYYGSEPWDGAKDLHSLINWKKLPPELKEIVPNYSIYLLELNKYENLDDFHSDLKTVCRFLQNCNDDKKLAKMLKKHSDEFEDMAEDTYDLIGALGSMRQMTQLKNEFKREDGRYNMCKGMDDWLEKKRKEGLELGRSEGRDEGARAKLKELVEKRLLKGDTAEEISNLFEENIETICELIAEITATTK